MEPPPNEKIPRKIGENPEKIGSDRGQGIRRQGRFKMEDFRSGGDRSREDDFFFAQSVSCFFSFWSFAFNGEASVKREKGKSRGEASAGRAGGYL